MKTHEINSFIDYVTLVDNFIDFKTSLHSTLNVETTALFRGQSDNKPLLPSIARDNKVGSNQALELYMLNELKRRTALKINNSSNDEWEWLVIAQHFGMKTRLLDWTSNPLIALWFACSDHSKLNKDSYVFVLLIHNADFLLDKKETPSPFQIESSRIFKPTLNNERIIAQDGWFTAHAINSRSNTFVPLEKSKDFRKLIVRVKIDAKVKKEIIVKLNIHSINFEKLFPSIEGTCKQINWDFNSDNLLYEKYLKEPKMLAEGRKDRILDK